MPPTPSSIISDALNSLSKATNLALATVEDQARSDVSRANAEASEARRERDDALKALHTLKLEEKDWERREEAWKAAVDKAELTVKHQTETIAHLRAETHQWKTQLLRLEEASRQEIADWKEQYLRAEQDRCRLSSRIDELVAEQLAWNTQANAAMRAVTPRTPYPEFYEPSTASATTKRASTSSNVKQATPLVHAPDTDDSRTSMRKARHVQTPSKQPAQADHVPEATPSRPPKTRAQVNEVTASASRPPRAPHLPRSSVTGRNTPTANGAHPTNSQQAQSQPRQKVIRRVHAVISVPVKEEEDSEEELESDASGSPYEPEDEQPVRRRKIGRVSTSTTRRQSHTWKDEEEEEEEDEGLARRRRSLVQDDDDDVDELAMTVEDSERYTQPVAVHIGSGQKAQRSITTGRPSGTGAGKKRKLDGESTGRTNTTKIARKK